jgi:uncharacterized membrane protein YjgN (DUF898 family)
VAEYHSHVLSPVPAPGAMQAEPINITFEGRGDRMIGLGAINGLLKVVTLGIYSFWAKTEIRRRIWSAVRLNGEPLAYTGTGKELFLGFLIVFAFGVIPVMLGGVAISALFAGNKGVLVLYQMGLYILFFLLWGNAIYRAQRYRLSRTEWRGIRGGLAGSPSKYGWTYFWTLAAPVIGIMAVAVALPTLASLVVTPEAVSETSSTATFTPNPLQQTIAGVVTLLGLAALLGIFPWRANKLQRSLTNDMRFGDQQLTYSGTSRPLYKRYLFAWAGSLVILAAAAAATAAYLWTTGLYVSWIMLKVLPTALEIAPLIGIWLAAMIASAVLTSWYRATQMNHFARHTHFAGATFRGQATGRSLMWLVLSNWLLSLAGVAIGAAIGGSLIYALAVPSASAGAAFNGSAGGPLTYFLMMPPLVILTTLTATIAQYRSARYFLSRLKLDGPVNLGAILQGKSAGPTRGEGLAQVFDIDAF